MIRIHKISVQTEYIAHCIKHSSSQIFADQIYNRHKEIHRNIK